MSWNLKKNRTHEKILSLSANQISIESKKNYFSPLEMFASNKMSIDTKTKKLSQYFWKKNNFNITKHHTYTKLLTIPAYRIFIRRIRTRDTHDKSPFTKTKLLTETLMEKCRRLFWGKGTLNFKTIERTQCAVFGSFSLSAFRCKEWNVKFDNLITIYKWENVNLHFEAGNAANGFGEEQV